MYKSHLDQTVLDHIPKDAFSRLDDKEMMDKPDLDEYVFVKVKETCEIMNVDLCDRSVTVKITCENRRRPCGQTTD